MNKKFLAALVAVVVPFSLVACSASSGDGSSDDVITFQLSMTDNKSSNYYQGAAKIAEEVDKATDGRVQINVVAGGGLGDERGTLEMAMNGDLDIVTAANPVFTNWIPEMAALDQPFLFDSAEQAHAAVDGEVGELIEAAAGEKDLRILGYMESGFRNVFSTKPIAEIADFNGVTIRTMQNKFHMAAFDAFGTQPEALPAGDQFTALQQGTIDAAENATANMLASRFFEVTKHHAATEHAFVYILVAISDKAWNKIPADLQPVVADAVRRGAEAQRGYLAEANSAAVEKLQAEGVEFHDIDRASLVAAYEATAQEQGFVFDPEWMAAIEKARTGK